MVIKKYQLLKYKHPTETVDLTDAPCIAIGKKAFFKKNKPEEVIFPTQISAVKAYAFAKCGHLKNVVIPEDTRIGLSTSSFFNCQRLQNLQNSEGITVIGNTVFKNCYALEQIHLGSELRRIGEYAFQNCHSLKEIALTSEIQLIGRYAFSGCWSLEKVVLEEGFTSISEGMFQNCIALKEVEIPSTVSKISAYAYQNCSALEQIFIPCNVKSIDKGAFSGCSRLKSANIELGCTKIGAYAFANNRELEDIVLPHSVKHLGFGAFGFRKREKKIQICVDNEYMLRRIRRKLFWCGSFLGAEAVMIGKNIEERKRERRRKTLEQNAVHISENPHFSQKNSEDLN